MKNQYLTLFFTLILLGCGGGSDGGQSGDDEAGQPPIVFPAANGSGYSNFIDLTFPSGGYLDITTFKSSVGLYTTSLASLDEDLSSSDYINPGTYKLKLTYQPTSNLPGNVTIFSLLLNDYEDLPKIQSKVYNAVGAYGTYSEYYKFNQNTPGNVDVTTSKAAVYVYNLTLHRDDGLPLAENFEPLTGNTLLNAGQYLFKFTYVGTSLTPGTVSIFFGD